MGSKFIGQGFRLKGSGLGFRSLGLGVMVRFSFGFGVWNLDLSSGFTVLFRFRGTEFMGSGLGIWVYGVDFSFGV